jgi:hypothetical protein
MDPTRTSPRSQRLRRRPEAKLPHRFLQGHRSRFGTPARSNAGVTRAYAGRRSTETPVIVLEPRDGTA